jgi:hypothetical protein
VCHVLLTGAGWLLDIRVVSYQHVLVDQDRLEQIGDYAWTCDTTAA